MPTREEMLAEAETEIRRTADVLDGLDRDLGAAKARAEEIENESFSTPEEAAEISNRHAVVEREIERIQQEVTEAEDDVRRAQDTWEHYDRESGDNPDEEDDTGDGESLSAHDAADIWLSRGMDEDYTFGFSDAELRRAAGLG